MDEVRIEIILGNGQLAVNGAIENLPLALGLLDMARHSLHKYHEQKQQRVQLVPAGLAQAFKGDGSSKG